MIRISYKNLKRYKEIGYIFVKYGFSYVVEKLNIEGIAYKIPITNPPEEIKNMSTGERLRKAFEELGPTYVKLGQVLSTRSDLLDQSIIDELAKLQDDVEPYDTEIAKNIFKEETGIYINEAFIEFNDKPIGAASIGQVYEAKLKSGESVIIKIQRPNVESKVKADLEIMSSLVQSINDIYKDSIFEFDKFVEEFENQLFRELDYNFEARNAEKFRNIFKEDKTVHIPKVFMEYSTKKILVLEQIIGLKANDVDTMKSMNWDMKNISDIGVKSFLKQVFEHGFFHADPHPGNIFVVSSNCIAYIDFGMVGIIDNTTLTLLNDMFIASVNKNIDRIIYILMELDSITEDTHIPSLRNELSYLIHYYYDISIEKVSLSNLFNEIFRFARNNKLSLPSQFVMLGRAIMTLEGTGRLINPQFSIGSVGQDFAKEYYLNKFKPKNILLNSKNYLDEIISDIRTLPKQLRSILRSVEKNELKIGIDEVRFSTLENNLTSMANKLSVSVVLAALIVGSSLIISSVNVENNRLIQILAGTGFFISFMMGLSLVISIIRSQYKQK
ncbi:MAG TPA: AarF/ABC1/UbiB kinase family protein [Peptostreptococcaceae bacterium]|nr:AarF/ABC1/UbiB kinase family protein [Peptostreptococcaceae bacterium]